MTEKILKIKNLNVTYVTDDGVIHAVNNLNIEMNKKETLGLVGETGAGKTTAALSIMRLLPDDIGKINEGSIMLDGKNIVDLPEVEMKKLRGRVVSMIFQDPMTSLNPIMTVGRQISEVLELHYKSMSKRQMAARVDELLELVGLPKERKNEYPHQFSGGMKQRVVIAMALACEPNLLLADEPTTALDVTIQAQVLEMMNDLKDKLDTSMLLITHDLGVVAQMCDKVAIMYAGEIIEYGNLEDIFEGEIHHPYTVGLFGSIPDLTKSFRRLNPIDGLMPDPSDLPSGCKFHERCPKCADLCIRQSPAEAVRGGHMIKCHLYNEGNI